MKTEEMVVGTKVKFMSWLDVFEIRGWSQKGMLTILNARTGKRSRFMPTVNTICEMTKLDETEANRLAVRALEMLKNDYTPDHLPTARKR